MEELLCVCLPSNHISKPRDAEASTAAWKLCESIIHEAPGTGYLPDQPFPLVSLHISYFGPVGRAQLCLLMQNWPPFKKQRVRRDIVKLPKASRDLLVWYRDEEN